MFVKLSLLFFIGTFIQVQGANVGARIQHSHETRDLAADVAAAIVATQQLRTDALALNVSVQQFDATYKAQGPVMDETQALLIAIGVGQTDLSTLQSQVDACNANVKLRIDTFEESLQILNYLLLDILYDLENNILSHLYVDLDLLKTQIDIVNQALNDAHTSVAADVQAIHSFIISLVAGNNSPEATQVVNNADQMRSEINNADEVVHASQDVFNASATTCVNSLQVIVDQVTPTTVSPRTA